MNVLYLSHTGLAEPLGQRQVLPYLEGLAGRGWRFTVVSFEKPGSTSRDTTAVNDRLHGIGANWIPLAYRPRVGSIGKIRDLIAGVRAGARVRSVDLLHARSTLPAAMAVLLARRLHAPWLFDLRGLLAQEYVDAEHWRRGGLSHRITERAERSLLAAADGVVVLTRAIHRELVETGALSAEAISAVIPCAVDLDEFRPEPSRRALWRHRLGVGDEPLLVYSGTLGSWYRPSEMIDFWLAAREQVPGLRFLFLTPQVEAARQLVRARDLEGQTIIQSAAPYEVPGCLAACDAGICFLAPVPSKRASTPTKYGEYLGAGLPIVVDAWTGDVAHLASSDAVITLPRFDAPAYAAAAKTLAQRLRRGAAATAEPLALAAREFALPTAVDRYHHIYRSMVERRGQRAAAGRTR